MSQQEDVVKEKTNATLSYEDFEPLLGRWATKFRPFIESSEIYSIYQKIKKDAEKEVIVPQHENVFRAFKECPPEVVKTIWYMMDPYAKRYKNKQPQATGIAMDCSNSPEGKLQPSLEKFYEGMEKDLGRIVEHSPNLEYLTHQGVLLLNTDLTCKLNKTGSHKGLWEPFHKYFLEEVMRGQVGIVYVLAGKESCRVEKYINPLGNYIYKIDHPVAASYARTDWNCKEIFSKINRHLKQDGKNPVLWDKRLWDEEPPF